MYDEKSFVQRFQCYKPDPVHILPGDLSGYRDRQSGLPDTPQPRERSQPGTPQSGGYPQAFVFSSY